MLGVAPTDLVVTVDLASSVATLDFTLASWKDVVVYSPSGEELAISTDLLTVTGPLRLTYTFLTEVDGVYIVGNEAGEKFSLPILGKTYACRNDRLLQTELCDCHTELDKTLRTLDVLLRCVVAMSNAGNVRAQDLFLLASTLCDCICHA